METTTLTSSIEQIKPQLKVGTMLLPGLERTYVGGRDEGLEIASASRAVLSALDGRHTCEELSQEFGIDLSEIHALVSELDNAHLIDTHTSKISVHTRFHSPNAHRASHDSDDSNDGAFQQLRAKLEPELSFATWHPRVRDGGVASVGLRRNWQVRIYGDCRISTLLYGILLASGVSQTSLAGIGERRNIVEQDLCSGFLHPSDIGHSYSERTRELSRELSLFPPSPAQDLQASQNQRIMVSVGEVPAEQLQKWMSEGIPHLLIDRPDGAHITLGPIVIPGKTPCARCITLARQDHNRTWRDIAIAQLHSHQEVPVSTAHFVAGAAGLELLRFIDDGSSSLLGTSARINYHEPTHPVQHRFALHPACGCNW
jgi:hypothetical protein